MPATGKITLDASDYKKTLEEVKSKTANASAEMSNAVKKFGGDVGKVGGVVSSLSSEVGSSFGQIGRVIGAVASGPVAILAATFGTLAAIGKTMWDKMTVSAGEYIAKLGKVIDQDKKHTEAVRSKQEEENAMIDRLQELITREHKSNEEKTEAVRLTALLVEKYPDLRKELNKTTGEFKDLGDAIEKVNELQKAEKISALQTQIENMTTKNQKLVESHYKGGMWTRLLDWSNEKLGGTNVGQSQVDYYNVQSVEDRLRLSKNALRDASTEDDIRFWSDQIDALEEIIKLQKQLDSLRETGFETTKQEAAALKDASEAEKAKREEEEKAEKAKRGEEEKAWKSYNDARVKAEQDAERRAEEAARRDLEALKREENARRKEQQSFRSTALRAAGFGARAAREEALLAAEMRVGGPLNEEQYRHAVDFANAKFRLENFHFNAPQDFAPRVNSLVARGGSDAPVSMPKIEDLQAQTLTNVKTIKDLAARFLDAAEAWGTF